LVSWLALRGRCRNCRSWIGWRYPLVEVAVGALWAITLWHALRGPQDLSAYLAPGLAAANIGNFLYVVLFKMVLYWLLVALAVFDAEYFWLPDWLTIPAAALGFLVGLLHLGLLWILASPTPLLMRNGKLDVRHHLSSFTVRWILGIVAAAGLILLIRWIYWLVRRREGIGLGDAKLMVLLAVFLGPSGTLLAFVLGVFLGALVALIMLALSSLREESESWAMSKLPLGTFLCVGGIISSLWGQPIIAAYLRWAGL